MSASDDDKDSVKHGVTKGVHAAAVTISQWLREHDIWLHPTLAIESLADGLDEERLERTIQRGDETPRPLGIFLPSSSSPLPIPAGTPIALIPKTSCFSPKTSALRPHLAKLDIDPVFGPQATSGLLLSFCLLYEKHLGDTSAFDGYIRSLPRERPGGQFGICLPLELGEKTPTMGAAIPGSETARLLQRAELRARDSGTSPGWPSHSSDAMALSLLRQYYTQTVLPFFTELESATGVPLPSALWSDFLGSYSLVASRAFVCDTYHGLALVPLADIFNHSEPAEDGQEDTQVQQHVQFECEDIVCSYCGSLTDSETGRYSKDCKSCYQHKPRNCEKQSSADDDDDDLIYMTTIVPLYTSPSRRVQIFNNYGPLSPARLLTSYGFVAEQGPQNKWERYTWDWKSSAEKAELLAVLGLLDQEGESQGIPRKRRHEDGSDGGSATTNFRSLDSRHRWANLVSSLAATCEDGVEELFPSPDTSNGICKDGPLADPCSSTRLLPLPKRSPFLPLDTPTGSERACSDLLVSPNRDHAEYTADEVLPLFIDGGARVSRPLWTICLLAALVRHTSSAEQATWSKEELRRLVASVGEGVQARLAEGLTSVEPTQPLAVHHEKHGLLALQRRILSSATKMLHTLVQARRDSIPSHPAPELAASSAKDDSLESCAARLVQRERLVLSKTLQKLEELTLVQGSSSP